MIASETLIKMPVIEIIEHTLSFLCIVTTHLQLVVLSYNIVARLWRILIVCIQTHTYLFCYVEHQTRSFVHSDAFKIAFKPLK